MVAVFNVYAPLPLSSSIRKVSKYLFPCRPIIHTQHFSSSSSSSLSICYFQIVSCYPQSSSPRTRFNFNPSTKLFVSGFSFSYNCLQRFWVARGSEFGDGQNCQLTKMICFPLLWYGGGITERNWGRWSFVWVWGCPLGVVDRGFIFSFIVSIFRSDLWSIAEQIVGSLCNPSLSFSRSTWLLRLREVYVLTLPNLWFHYSYWRLNGIFDWISFYIFAFNKFCLDLCSGCWFVF